MIRFYLGEEPILTNVPTYHAATKPRTATTCSRTSPSWWSRRCTARAATACWSARRRRAAEREAFRERILAAPEKYIAQPTLALSTCPTFVERGHRAAARRPAALRAVGHGRRPRARRPDARRAARRLAGRELVAGRRHEGHLGARELGPRHALPHRQRALLDGAPHRARGEHRAPARRHLPDVAAALRAAASPASRGPSRGRCRSSHGLATAYYERYPAAHRRERAALHDPRRRQPVVDLLLPARGARIGAHRCAARSPPRCTRT